MWRCSSMETDKIDVGQLTYTWHVITCSVWRCPIGQAAWQCQVWTSAAWHAAHSSFKIILCITRPWKACQLECARGASRAWAEGRTTTVRELQGAERIETREVQATNEVDAMLLCTHVLGLVLHRKKLCPSTRWYQHCGPAQKQTNVRNKVT